MRHLVLVVCWVLIGLGAAAWAQTPAPGGTGGRGGPARANRVTTEFSGNTLMTLTGKGLFVLRNGELAKFTAGGQANAGGGMAIAGATTLQPGPMVSLLGPAPAAPAETADRQAMQGYLVEMGRRQAPAIMLAAENALLIVIGDQFFKLNQDTLATEVQTNLSAATGAAPAPEAAPEGTPGYMLVGPSLVLMRNTDLLIISTENGTIQARTELAKSLQAAPVMRGGFGGRMGGGRMGN